MAEEKRIDLSIVIVNWNVKDLLEKCLVSILNCVKGCEYEIIVIDNASSDGSVQMIQERFLKTKLIKNDKNVGFSKANNQGIGLCRGRNILILNPDTLLTSISLQRMIEKLDASDTIGALGCKILYFDGTIQNTCARSFPTPLNQFWIITGLAKLFPKSTIFGKAMLTFWDHNSDKEVECISGACMLVKKKVLDEIGLFDESYFMYGEDIDLNFRIWRAGYKIYYLNSEQITHLSGMSSGKSENRSLLFALMHDANYKFMKNNYGPSHALFYRALVLIGSLWRIGILTVVRIALKIARRSDESYSGYNMNKYISTLRWSLHLVEFPQEEQNNG